MAEIIDVEVSYRTPTEMAWQPIDENTWETPTGQRYIFPPGGPQVLMQMHAMPVGRQAPDVPAQLPGKVPDA